MRNQKIKVCFLNLNTGPHGEYGALLAAAVARQKGIEVLSIVPEELISSERARSHLNGTLYHTVPMSRKIDKVMSLLNAWSKMKAFAPDIIHDPIGSGITTMLPLRPFLGRLARVVVTEHNPSVHVGMSGWHHGPARALTRRTASLIHAHGPQAVSELRKLGVESERIVMIRHGAFDEYGAEAKLFVRGGTKQILVFGALRPNKGIDMLPDILEKVREHHPDVTLLITGKRPQRLNSVMAKPMDDALKILACTEGVTVTDARVPEEEIPRLFGECGLCLLPYRSATQSGVAMIAMATGAPLVATGVGDLPDIVDDRVTGLLAVPTVEDIADKIISVFDDPSSATQRAAAAANFARAECAWPVIGDKMSTAYRNLLDGKTLSVGQ